MEKWKARAAVLVGAIYLLNPGWGVFELIPDNIPFIGNLDEGAATVLLLWGWRRLKELSSPGALPK
ncbi:MAG: YkvA family protein [Verrucomicrobiota bacterium]